LLACAVMGKVLVARVDWRRLVLVLILGFCIGLVSGFVENPPEASVIGHKYYGYPLVRRITRTFLG
jgi:hypothetical protein